MSTLTNTKIKDTYKSLLKVSDNGNLEASLQEITDGEGNASGVQLNTGGDLTASGTVSFGSLKDSGENITIAKFVDEADGIAGNDNDTSIPTSAAVKDYVDTKVTAEDLDFAGDSGTGAIDLDSQTFTISGTANEVVTSASGQTITIGLPTSISVDVVGDLTGTVTATSVLADGVTATTQSAGDNSTKVATTAYVDSIVTAQDLDFAGDSGTGAVDLDSQTLTIAGTANEIETSASGQTITIGLPSSVTVGTLSATTLAGTLSTAAQPNITSVGTLSSLAVSGNLAVDTNTLYVDAANNRVGVRTSSPAFNFDLSTNNGNGLRVTNGTDSASIVVNSGRIDIGSLSNTPITFTVNDTERMRIDSSGNVGIGESNPSYKLDVSASSGEAYIRVNSAANQDGGFRISEAGTNKWLIYNVAASDALAIYDNTANSERMRITSGGLVNFGSETLSFNSNGVLNIFNSSTNYGIGVRDYYNTSQLIVFVNASDSVVGSITQTGSSTSYNTTSDYRLKENVVEMTGALDRVDALKPSRFNFIADPEKTVDGFLAHEVAEVVPEAISGEKDAVDEEGNPIYQGIDQSKIVPLLVGAIKELSAKVAALESQLNA